MNYLVERVSYRVNLALLSTFARMSNQSIYTHVLAVSVSAILLSISLVCEIAVFFKKKFSIMVVVDVIPVAIVNIGCLVTLPIVYANRKNFDKLREIFTGYLLKPYNEVEAQLKRKYEKCSHLLLNLILFAIIATAPCVFLMGMTSQILDIVLPINGTRNRALPFPGEFFIDDQRYFYHILMLEYFTGCVVSSVIGSIESMFIATVYFMCGMLLVIGYRLENIISKSDVLQNEEIMVGKIRQFMADFRKMRECIALLNQCGDFLTPFLLLATVSAFSMTLVQATNIESINFRSVVFAFVQITQFFVVSYVAEALLSSSAVFFNTIYNVRWYDCPLKIQRMFVPLLLAVRKPFGLCPKGLFVLSLETFGGVTQTAISYFMVLRQFQ